jgi:hypothetical protein
MNNEVLLALGGVLLGWFLSELAGAFRIAREERHLVRHALPPLLTLYFEQYRINEILSFFNRKMGDDFERFVLEAEKDPKQKSTVGGAIAAYLANFEDLRQHNVTMPQANRDSLIETLANATDGLAGVDPISAYQAKQLMSEFLLFQDIKMPASGSAPQIYVQFLGGVLSVFRNDITSLRKLILVVARQASLFDCWRIKKLIGELEGQLDGGMKRAFGQIVEKA